MNKKIFFLFKFTGFRGYNNIFYFTVGYDKGRYINREKKICSKVTSATLL